MYYFGNWHANAWSRIMTFTETEGMPNIEPLRGWYNDLDMGVFNDQMLEMANGGVDFVTFAWFSKDGGIDAPYDSGAERFVEASPEVRARLQYNIMWENFSACPYKINKDEGGRLEISDRCGNPSTVPQWDSIVQYWIEHYLTDDNYWHFDGKPVVSIYNEPSFRYIATRLYAGQGLTPQQAQKAMIDRAQELAIAADLPGIYFVLCAPTAHNIVREWLPQMGVDALSAYNMHSGPIDDAGTDGPVSHSFQELDNAYRAAWEWMINNSPAGSDGKTAMPYFVPVSAGWDRRPWGGSDDPLHDLSRSTPVEWRNHLEAAYRTVAANPIRTGGVVMACCWNEYGEGSIIEPTVQWDTAHIDLLREVFNGPVPGVTTLDVGASLPVAAGGGLARLSVTTNQPSWEAKLVSFAPNTIPLSLASLQTPGVQTGGELVVKFEPNDYVIRRAIVIEVTAGDATRRIRVYQEAALETDTPPPGTYLKAGQSMGLGAGQVRELTSPDWRFRLSFEDDGDVVFFDGDTRLWHLATAGTQRLELTTYGTFWASMPDNNHWQSGTYTQPIWWLVVQNDGRVLLVGQDFSPDSARVFWDSDAKVLPVTAVDYLPQAPRVGEPVTLTDGVPDYQVIRKIQWLRGGQPIDGATGESYTPTAHDVGQALSVEVTTDQVVVGRVGQWVQSPARIVQGEAEPYLELGASVLRVGAGGGVELVGVLTNQSTWSVSVPASAGWLQVPVGPQSGGSLVLGVDQANWTVRSAVVTVRAGSLTRSLVVDQAPAVFTALQGMADVARIQVVPGGVSVSGWAFDPADPGRPVQVRLMVDGPTGGGCARGQAYGPFETDVNRLMEPENLFGLPAGSTPGFNRVVPVSETGLHRVTLCVSNRAGTETKQLGIFNLDLTA